jgi:septal ring factor EnvC (AmiA/AmiB activator)
LPSRALDHRGSLLRRATCASAALGAAGVAAVMLAAGVASAAARPASGEAPANPAETELADKLAGIRGRVVELEASLLEGLKSKARAKASVAKIQRLIGLQRLERDLGKKRLGELEAKVLELESRRGSLGEKIKAQQAEVRRSLKWLELPAVPPEGLAGPGSERLEAPRRKALANLADRGLKEAEALKIDLADAEQLENRIQDEKQQLAYLFEDLQEKESVLELNKALQIDLIRKNHDERVAQLESYRRLKASQSQVERLIGQFNARMELERANEAERQASRAVPTSGEAGAFAHLKGKLGLPVADGKVISSFGRSFDPRSRLYIFKKGIDIATAKSAGVRAVSAGKVAYSGELPDYGRVTILDHGDHFYSICAHLGELKRKAGDTVAAGDLIGLTDESGTPVYFEIRARNVAVNPLQWISNTFILSK